MRRHPAMVAMSSRYLVFASTSAEQPMPGSIREMEGGIACWDWANSRACVSIQGILAIASGELTAVPCDVLYGLLVDDVVALGEVALEALVACAGLRCHMVDHPPEALGRVIEDGRDRI